MKRRFIKGLSVATAICISVSGPMTTIAQETTSGSTTVSESGSTETNNNENQNQEDSDLESGNTDSSNSESLYDEEDLPYEVTNSESGTEIVNDQPINTDNRGIEATNESAVKQIGDVNTKDDAIFVYSGANVSVEGNVTATDTEGNQSLITGVNVVEGEAIIDGNITVNTEGVIGSESIAVSAGNLKKQNGSSSVTINGDITATANKTGTYHQTVDEDGN